jgi:hypothetical protein
MIWKKLVPVILVVVLLALFAPVPVSAAGNVYYVAKNGSNSNPGTEAQPWLTIQKAASTLVAGDTVYVKAGTYYEQVIPARSGSAGSPITYKNYGTDKVIIDGSGLSISNDSQGVFQIAGTPSGASTALNYITVDGFTICNTYSSGVVIYGETHYITLKNLTIYNARWCGILVTYNYRYSTGKCTDIVIDGCEIYNTNSGNGDESISLVGMSNFEVKNCKVHDVPTIAIDMKVGTTNGSVHGCEVYNAGSGIYIDSSEGVADSVSIYNNLCHDIQNSGIEIGAERSPSAPITNLRIYNNIIYSDATGIALESYNGGPSNCSFSIVNNTIYQMYGHGSRNIVLKNPYTKYSSGVIRNNILVGLYSDQTLLEYADYNDSTKTDPAGHVIIDNNLFYDAAGYSNVIKYGTNSIKANPLLVSPTSNFSIASGSPAIDAGSSSNAPSFDYASASRPQGSGYDIGAYEYQSGGSTNQAPVLAAIGNKTVNAGQTLTFQISATDPNGNSLTYSASNLPSGSSFNNSTRTFTWTPTSSQAGAYSNVRFNVSDGSLTDYENITITVNSVNQAPVLAAIGSKTIDAGETLTFSISATDPDGNSLTYSASNLPSGSAFNASTRTFTWTPDSSQAGTYSNVRFTVSDGSLTDYENITITVSSVDVNQAPVLSSIGSKTVTTGQSLTFTISASDPDGDSLTYSASSLPGGASFSISTRRFSWTPDESQSGTYNNVRFIVSDGNLTDYENITITVTTAYVNEAPVLAPIGNKSVTAGQTLTFTISATDPNDDQMSCGVDNLPSGASLNYNTGTFTWTPGESQVGTYPNVRFYVSDGNLTDSESITITVNAVVEVPEEPVKPSTPGSSGGSGGGGGVSSITSDPSKINLNLSGFVAGSSLLTDMSGSVVTAAKLSTQDGKVIINVPQGTMLYDSKGQALKSFYVLTKDSMPDLPPNTDLISNYIFGPEGAQIVPGLTLTIKYNPTYLARGVTENNLYISYWDGCAWNKLESRVDILSRTISANITHFSQYAVLADIIQPAEFSVSNLMAIPVQNGADNSVDIKAKVSNIGGRTGFYELVLKLNGIERDNQEITLAKGQTEIVEFRVRDIPGEYTYEINGKTGRFEILEAEPTVSPEATIAPEVPQTLVIVSSAPLKPVHKSTSATTIWWIVIIVLGVAEALGIVLFIRRRRASERWW